MNDEEIGRLWVAELMRMAPDVPYEVETDAWPMSTAWVDRGGWILQCCIRMGRHRLDERVVRQTFRVGAVPPRAAWAEGVVAAELERRRNDPPRILLRAYNGPVRVAGTVWWYNFGHLVERDEWFQAFAEPVVPSMAAMFRHPPCEPRLVPHLGNPPPRKP